MNDDLEKTWKNFVQKMAWEMFCIDHRQGGSIPFFLKFGHLGLAVDNAIGNAFRHGHSKDPYVQLGASFSRTILGRNTGLMGAV
jgi:hypothetical protein